MLATAGAHGMYGALGFSEIAKPDRFMERYHPARELYARSEANT